ncbi:DUF3667 domain-containing protein [Lysobacter panacisoli]|uniref:DUF3667 domain-containing protein n=1 Tax=Lysobacter panacisoli TaxID=1255263 RepID=A0ABP9L276_9GAMM|nr:DUF3667 domain-containing protein [Lysobacter panacisoli]
MSTSAGHAVPTHCENCGAPLQGHYCQDCGQSVVNPIRDTAHAVEEVFEAFWHLDGRIFRTLRDLLSPGRVAVNYLAGQRARYVAPLRLFVVLSVLTFFVAQLVIHVDSDSAAKPMVELEQGVSSKPQGSAKESKRFAEADTIAQVEKLRRRELDDLAEARDAIPAVLPHARKAIDVAANDVNLAADRRVDVLRIEGGLTAAQVLERQQEARAEFEHKDAETRAIPSMEKATSLADLERLRDVRLKEQQAKLVAIPQAQAAARTRQLGEIRETNQAAGCRAAQLQIAVATATEGGRHRKATEDSRIYGDIDCDGRLTLFGSEEPWDEETNPLTFSWAPSFFNRWVNKQIAHGKENLSRAQKDPSLYVRALLGAVPSALFLLVPVFALLLKIAYLGSGRLYLEHLVVALYSHAYMCLAILTLFLLIGLDGAITPHWSAFGWIAGTLETLLWLWLPVYLWLMQKRVYRNGWLLTTVRYLVIGNLYFMLLGFAAAFLALASIVRM